jgi:integrase/recombinase XerD
MWVHGKSPNTKRAYSRSVANFQAFVGKPLRWTTLSDLQAFENSLTGKRSSRAVHLRAIKSLLTFCFKIGATQFNVGAVFVVKASPNNLAARFLSESEVQRMLVLSSGREHALVRLCYGGGFRVSEVVGLRWSEVVEANGGGVFVTVTGKGDKTRTVRLSAETASVLAELRGEATDDGYVFAKRNGKRIATVSARRMVIRVARAASIKRPVSPHFLRHSHASHALERGASLVLVRDTLGHASIATTDRYLHARPGESSSKYLPV